MDLLGDLSDLLQHISSGQENDSATKLELLAIVWAVEKLKRYLRVPFFTLITDHKALTYMWTQSNPRALLIRYVDQIMSYNFDVIHCPGTLNVVADALPRHIPDDDLMSTSTPSSLTTAFYSIVAEPVTIASLKDKKTPAADEWDELILNSLSVKYIYIFEDVEFCLN